MPFGKTSDTDVVSFGRAISATATLARVFGVECDQLVVVFGVGPGFQNHRSATKEYIVMRLPTIQHFGACPFCHEQSYYLNLRSDHWFVCDQHKLAWCVGSNLFSSWKYETEEDWEHNQKKLEAGYEPTSPAMWAWEEVSLRFWIRDWCRLLWWRSIGERFFERKMRKRSVPLSELLRD